MQRFSRASQHLHDKVFHAIEEYYLANGFGASFRDIQRATGIGSLSTVDRYVKQLRAEGLIIAKRDHYRTLIPTALVNSANENEGMETVQKRVCIFTADGGKVYLDYKLIKPKDTQTTLVFDGILDAEKLKSKIGRIVNCAASDE